MNFWSWFWIWSGLVLTSLVLLSLIGKSLINRLGEVLHQIERLARKFEVLVEAAETAGEAVRPQDDLGQDPGLALAKWRRILNTKAKKREARQRRLIASLKAFKPEESRFH